MGYDTLLGYPIVYVEETPLQAANRALRDHYGRDDIEIDTDSPIDPRMLAGYDAVRAMLKGCTERAE